MNPSVTSECIDHLLAFGKVWVRVFCLVSNLGLIAQMKGHQPHHALPCYPIEKGGKKGELDEYILPLDKKEF